MFKHSRSRNQRIAVAATAALTAIALLILSLVGSSAASAATAPGLGTASSFAVLGATQVTNAGITTVSGNLGVSPGTAVTGGPIVINGVIHSADAVALQAKNDALGAYTTAMNEVSTPLASAELGGKIFPPGAYDAGTLGLTGTLVLDGLNDPTSVFIFKSASDLITASNSVVTLVNGANACNVFWQVTSSATLGTNTVFAGTLLASTSVFAGFGTDVEGRLFANTGQVTLDTATVVLPRCGGVDTTTTITAAGPTTTVAGPATTETTTVAGSTTTVAGSTTTVAGPTTTVAGPTTTVAGPTTTVAGSTTTVAGSTTTVAG
ncbi:MAG: hypothetical protein JWN20_318, partial [Jatrophihabitantaceae bacterium]|nr:hypothetical protein [Jatrophihabitantaceae bacterium]